MNQKGNAGLNLGTRPNASCTGKGNSRRGVEQRRIPAQIAGSSPYRDLAGCIIATTALRELSLRLVSYEI